MIYQFFKLFGIPVPNDSKLIQTFHIIADLKSFCKSNVESPVVHEAVLRGEDDREDGSDDDPGHEVGEEDYGLHASLELARHELVEQEGEEHRDDGREDEVRDAQEQSIAKGAPEIGCLDPGEEVEVILQLISCVPSAV